MRIKREIRYWWQKVKNVFHLCKALFWVVRCGYPARKLTVVGVTGTDGKTTTCTLIYEVLRAAGKNVALVSTVNAKIGSEEIDTGFHTTNPDPSVLQPLLKKMVDRGVTHLVLEVTAHGLDQLRVWGCNFKIGVLTNISHEHLDDFVNMDRYKWAKLKLFEKVKYAVLNIEDGSYEYFKKNISELNPDAKILSYKSTKISRVSDSLRGEYNRQNIGAVEVVADVLGVKKEVVAKTVEGFKGVAGRREEVVVGGKFRVVVDFAHTPNALRQILGQLRKELAKKSKLIVVFGATGGRDQEKRPMMGKVAEELADVVIVTSDDTRNESQDTIYSHIERGVVNKEKLIKENDRKKAIEKAISLASSGDIVLLAGKGHEKSLLLGKVEHEWSDVDVAKKAMSRL
jgi:UDP-N-acetylmuramoyl-L-alanyl-D-glutamate--2,6-diaminopimelate ligase